MYTKMLLGLLVTAAVCAPVAVSAQQGGRALSRRADAIVAEHATAGHPGCAVGVYQDGRTLYEGAYGLANLQHSVPIDPQNTVFDVGSVSKQFTAASILLLVQDGELALEDDIRRYLPEIPDYGHVITIDHLLHHTSGLRDYLSLMALAGRPVAAVLSGHLHAYERQPLRRWHHQRDVHRPGFEEADGVLRLPGHRVARASPLRHALRRLRRQHDGGLRAGLSHHDAHRPRRHS